jgi:hypothetical protein
MELESYKCEKCILQIIETIYHLLLRCNFAKNCWNSIGVIPPGIDSMPSKSLQWKPKAASSLGGNGDRDTHGMEYLEV